MKKIIHLILALVFLFPIDSFSAYRRPCAWARIKPPVGFQINWGHPLARGLVGCWLFNEGGGKKVLDIACLNNGAWNGTGSHWAAGKFGRSGNFNGTDDYVDAGNASFLQSTNGTVVAWVNYSSLPTYGVVFGKSDFNAGRNGYSFGQHSSKLFLEIASATTFQDLPGLTTLSVNTWYHIAATWDGTKVRVYLNGVQDNSANQALTPVTTVYNLVLGKSQVYNVAFFPGLIDNALVYNRALSGAEIQRLYSEPFCMLNTPRVPLIPQPAAVASTIPDEFGYEF